MTRVFARRDDGIELDITEEVQVAYDCVRQSLDWGSGFLDVEEVDAIIRLSGACGFPDFESVIRDVWADREAARRNQHRTSAYDPYVSAFTLRSEPDPNALASFRESVMRKPERP